MFEPSRRWRLFFPLIWLVYMTFPIFDMLRKPAPVMEIGFPLLALFVAAYLGSWWDRKRFLFYILLEMAIVAYASLVFGPGYLFMIFFVAPAIGVVSGPVKFRSLMVLLVAMMVGFFLYSFSSFSKDDLFNLLPSLVVAVLMPFGMRLGMRSRMLKGQLDQAQEEIARLSKREERQRISRDLHDTLGHTLSLIALKSELVEKLIAKQPERAVQEAKDIRTTARTALRQVRELVSEMAGATIREELDHAGRILAAASIALEVQGSLPEQDAQPFIQNVLGLCLREAITNVVKHSRASRCSIEVEQTSDSLTLSVCDNGRGMEPGSDAMPSSGRGLLGMKERLELVDGTMEFSSLQGGGTRIRIRVPRIIRGQEAGGKSG